MALYIPNQEELGRRRFPDNKGFRKEIRNRSMDILSQIEGLLPSNYPKHPSTNLAILNRSLAREIARIRWDNNAINNDKQYTDTRAEFLQQILGERLFLSDQIAPANYNDETFRNYLIAIKSAYLKGSRLEYIEALASAFIGQPVNIKELYLLAREPGSSYDVSDTNMMVVDVLISDSFRAGYNINNLLNDLNFYINLVRPAHVLYDTRLIWSEQIDVNKVHDIYFGDTGGGCIPVYDYGDFDQTTILAQQIFILPDSRNATGLIDSIHEIDRIFYFDDSTRVITEPGVNGTRIFDKDGRQVSFFALEIGQYVRVTYQIIPGYFQFYWYPEQILPTWESQFYKDVYRRPIFQEFVKKEMDANGRFPLGTKTTETTICDRWVQDTLQPLYEDMRYSCNSGSEHSGDYSSTLSIRMGKPRLSIPYADGNMALPGNDYSYWMLDTPLTDGSGNPATPVDVMVQLDGTAIPLQSVVGVDASSGKVQLSESYTYWDQTAMTQPFAGDSLLFSYSYLSDGTNYDTTSEMVFGVSSWQMPNAPLVQGDGNGYLAEVENVTVSVDGTVISDAVIGVTPLLGHVYLHQTADFWNSSELGRTPQLGDVFDFNFNWGLKYQYSAIFDELGRVMDGYVGSEMTYGIVFDADAGFDPEIVPIPLTDTTSEQIGYRYRGYLLHHSSVLNSPDTMLLNEFQKPATRASIINQADCLNHFNIFFSPEFLTDTSSVFLNDPYLYNGLDPVLKLNYGIPPFQKTFSYQPGLIKSRKLQDYRTNHELLLYSDLLLAEFSEGTPAHLSPICDSEKITFKIGLGEDIIPPIEECPPWELFDSYLIEDVLVSVPGETRGVPNLRVLGNNLRESFILREVESTGVAQYIYSFQTPSIDVPTEYYLPASFKYDYNDTLIDFPALPVVDSDGNLATVIDIQVTVDGVPWVVTGLDPVTGWVQLAGVISPNVPIVMTYYIRNDVVIPLFNEYWSRIFDSVDIFPGYCSDQEDIIVDFGTVEEYYPGLDDGGDGIKMTFLNKDTLTIEEHVFSGPIFEYFEASKDEIASPDNFPNALVRIPSALSLKNPLTYMGEYGFLNDKLARFRKTTFKELLPSRVFRTLELIEMLAV